MQPTLGFIGLGAMGEPMAANFLKAGYPLCLVVHVHREPVDRLRALGATEAAIPADLGARCDVVMVCVPNDEAVRQVTLGPQGLVHSGHAGLIVLDASTIAPETSQEVAAALAAEGITYMDTPISGGRSGAEAGTLAIMVGGPAEAYAQVEPVLAAVGHSTTYIGPNGSALVVKLCNNLIVGAMQAAIAEALTMAAKAGIDTGLAHRVLAGATARSWFLETRVPLTLLRGNTDPSFKLQLMSKDMGLAVEAGEALGTPMFVSGLVQRLYAAAEAQGLGQLDSTAISRLYTDAAGVSLVADEYRAQDAESPQA